MRIEKKNKLLFISGPLNGGGAEKVLLDILQHLDYDKYEVDLALIINQGILLDQVPKNVKIIPIWENYSLSFRIALRLSIWFNINYFLSNKFNRRITKDYDVVISCLEGLPLKLHTLLFHQGKNITWVHIDLNNFRYTEDTFYKKREIEAYAKMDSIVCVSNDTKMQYDLRFPRLSNKSLVLYNPVVIDNVIQKASEISPDFAFSINIVLVGRLTKQKRIDRALEAIQQLKSEGYNCILNIVGTGELVKELEELCYKLDVVENVRFIGYTPNPYPYIKDADILLSTSDYEGFGLVIVEAMALGTPVVATKTAGPTEIIANNQFGLLCELNTESVVNNLKRMIVDKELRMHYSTKGVERSQDFDVSKTIVSFNQLIVDILK